MSTRYYLDSKWPDLTPTQPSIKKVVEEVNKVNEIDEDIEKQIRQLQEQKFNKGIQKKSYQLIGMYKLSIVFQYFLFNKIGKFLDSL